MKRKFLVVLLAVITVLCMAFGFAGCSFSDKESGKTDPPVVDPSGDDKEQGDEQEPGGEGGSGQTEKPEPSFPKEGYSEDGLYFTLNADGKSYAVSRGEFNGSALVIPETFHDAPVTTIANNAFEDYDELTSIEIPDSVISIGEDAFNGCNRIIQEADNVSYVDQWVIGCSRSATQVTLRAGAKGIADSAFYYCSGLTSITIPGSVTSIGEKAFLSCRRLTSITIPDSVTSIGNYAFESCSGLTSVTIESGSIGALAFYDCDGLESVTIGSGVTLIGDSAFWCCSGLKKVHIFDLAAWCRIDFDYIYTNPLYYAHHLYLDGAELKDLTIPSEITEIKDYAFEGCSGLNSVTIGGGVTSIGRKAFGCCSGLTSMEIPDSVTSIGKEAFGCCSGLTEIKVNENNPIYHSDGNCLIETGSKTLILGCNTSKIPDDGSATLIGNSAFYGCSGLTSIEIPDSVTSIGKEAFYGCSGLTSVKLKNGQSPKTAAEINVN